MGTKTKHTPGPWHVKAGAAFGTYDISAVAHDQRSFGEESPNATTDAIDRANEALIAAAAELLAAAEAYLLAVSLDPKIGLTLEQLRLQRALSRLLTRARGES